MDRVETKREQRFLYLRRLYEKGCDELHPFGVLEVGRELGWEDETTDEIENFLETQRLVKFPAFGQVCITHLGQREVESTVNDLNQPLTPLNGGTHLGAKEVVSKNETETASVRSKSKAVPIALFILGIFVAIVSNVASSRLPPEFTPYLWLSWPLLVMLAAISIRLLLRQ